MVNSGTGVQPVDVHSQPLKSAVGELWHASLGEAEKEIVTLYTLASPEMDKQ